MYEMNVVLFCLIFIAPGLLGWVLSLLTDLIRCNIGVIGEVGFWIGVVGVVLCFFYPIVGIALLVLGGVLIIAGAIAKEKDN